MFIASYFTIVFLRSQHFAVSPVFSHTVGFIAIIETPIWILAGLFYAYMGLMTWRQVRK